MPRLRAYGPRIARTIGCAPACGRRSRTGSRWLRGSATPPAWYGAALLGGTLRILFEHWNVGRVRLGEDGPPLTRRQYFERLGLIRAAAPAPA